MKRFAIIVIMGLIASFAFNSCNKDTTKGTLSLSITDAPIDTDGITAVYITILEVQYHTNENSWAVFEDFEGPLKINLLELTRGESSFLGNLEMEAGTYTQLRFMLDAPMMAFGPISNPGCYLEFEDGTTKPLFVPSGYQTGYKAVGEFTVPANGLVSVTADFDVRKSVVKAGASGIYILKPTIRLIVDNQAGQIAGTVLNIPEGRQIGIYVYEENTYNNTEADEPANESTRFPNAITSDMVDENGFYYLAFLAAGTYELIVVSTIDGEFEEVLGVVAEINVESGKTTEVQIDILEL
jgi:hypothetical protein